MLLLGVFVFYYHPLNIMSVVHTHTHTHTHTALIQMAGEWYKDPAVVTALYDLAISNGLVRKHSTGVVDSSSVGMISVMATPSAFPEDLFALGCGIQPELNTLIDRVSLHHQFLVRALEK